MTRIAVIGLGYWGPNLVRNFADIETCQLAAICDLDTARLERMGRRYPGARMVRDVREIFQDTSIDAVAIATPTATHYPLAKAALESGKHVMVEKPLAATVAEAEELVAIAKDRGRALMVDHVFLYTPAVEKIRDLIKAGDLGDVLYFDSSRINLGLFQNDINVVWDLAPHDLSIMDFVLQQTPVAVQAVGASHSGKLENMAWIHMEFAGSLVAHVHVSWLAPVKIRRTLIGGTKRMIVYDDIEPTEKIRIYDKGVDIHQSADESGRFQTLISYRTGDVLAPKLDMVEGLNRACRDFLRLVDNPARPCRSDGQHGLRVVRLLETIQTSLRQSGQRITLTTQDHGRTHTTPVS